MKLKAFFKNSSGFTLVELAIATTILTTTLSVGLWKMAQDAKIDKGYALADQLKTISGGVTNYITTNYGQLSAAVPVVVGFANPMQPTIAELRTGGYLSDAISTTNIYGSGYAVVLNKAPASCVPPACNVGGFVSITDSLTQPASATPDIVVLGAASQRLGGDSAVSYTTATFEGAGGTWNMPNPLGKAGLLAIRSGYDSSGFTAFYRRDGSLPLTGHLAGGGKDINNVNTVNASGAVNAATVNASGNVSAATVTASGIVTAAKVQVPVGYNLQVGSTQLYGDTANTVIRQDGSLYLRRYDNTSADIAQVGHISASSISAASNITAAGTAAAGFVQVNNVAVANTACSPNGLVARDSIGVLITCQSGFWRRQINAAMFVTGTALSGTCAGGCAVSAYATCPAGKSLVTGGCSLYGNGPANTNIYSSYPSGDTWVCLMWNGSAAANGVQANATCL